MKKQISIANQTKDESTTVARASKKFCQIELIGNNFISHIIALR